MGIFFLLLVVLVVVPRSNESKYAEFLNVTYATNGIHVIIFTVGVKYVGLNVNIWKICLAFNVMLPWVG